MGIPPITSASARLSGGTTRWEENRIFGGCFPAPVGAHTADKHVGDRRTKGL